MERRHHTGTRYLALYHLLVVLGMVATTTAADYDFNNNYDYGDPNYHYEDPVVAERLGIADSGDGPASPRGSPLPLCCPPGTVYDYIKCRPPTEGELWEPHLDASPSAVYAYSTGFPSCTNSKRADLHQSEVFVSNTTIYVPHYIQLHPVYVPSYCVVRVSDPQDPVAAPCPRYATKVYACIDGHQAMGGAAWALVGIAHCLLLCAVVAFAALPELRALQGSYLLCMLVTLLLYNVLEFPASALAFSTSAVSCIALKAIKYFCFCVTFLWFNVICFDVWRTLRCGKDITGRRRFVLYSAFTWLSGAVLVVPLMVLVITSGAAGTTDVPGQDLPVCEVGLGVHAVLQLVQGITMLTNAVMLGLAASHLCRYTKLGCGLPRADASMCLKQTLKLYTVMVFHSIFSISPDILDVQVIALWQFMVLESVAVFAILVYRRSVLRRVRRSLCAACCRSRCPPAGAGGVYEVPLGGAHNGHGNGHDNGHNGSSNGLHLQHAAPEKLLLSSV